MKPLAWTREPPASMLLGVAARALQVLPDASKLQKSVVAPPRMANMSVPSVASAPPPFTFPGVLALESQLDESNGPPGVGVGVTVGAGVGVTVGAGVGVTVGAGVGVAVPTGVGPAVGVGVGVVVGVGGARVGVAVGGKIGVAVG